MSSAGRAASSSGCVARPRGHETGLTGYAKPIQRSLPTGGSAMETADHREPYEPRGSRTDLGAPGGESPPGDSTTLVAWRCLEHQQLSAETGLQPGNDRRLRPDRYLGRDRRVGQTPAAYQVLKSIGHACGLLPLAV